MSDTPDETKPRVFTIEVPADDETKRTILQFGVHGREVYLPADVIKAYKADIRALAERCEIRSIMTKEGKHLFPSQWLAAARPEIADHVHHIAKLCLKRIQPQ